MTTPRVPFTVLALLTLPGPVAHAQQWGGSPPVPVTRPAVTARTTTTSGWARSALPPVLYVDPTAVSFVLGEPPAMRSRPSSGGSWNGGSVQWGGSPQPARVGPVPGGSTPGAGTSAPPARSRAEQYLMRRGRP